MGHSKYILYHYPFNDEYKFDTEVVKSYDILKHAWSDFDDYVKKSKAVSIWEYNESNGQYEKAKEFIPEKIKSSYEKQQEQYHNDAVTILKFISDNYKDVKVPAPLGGYHSLKKLSDIALDRLTEYFSKEMMIDLERGKYSK